MSSRWTSRPSLREDLSGYSMGVGSGWRGGNVLVGSGMVRTLVLEEAGGAGAMASVSWRASRCCGVLGCKGRRGLCAPAGLVRVLRVMVGLSMYVFIMSISVAFQRL